MDEIDSEKYKQFVKFKEQCLNKTDLSRKGSIDDPIRRLVEIINENPFYYTTSTCSGRITAISKPELNSGKKKESVFHLNSHQMLEPGELNEVVDKFLSRQMDNAISSTCWESQNGPKSIRYCLWLKFEPFIMHIQCYDLKKAKKLLNMALANGCRNSGITLGKPDKFMVAIRSTGSLESPVHLWNKFELNTEHVEFLQEECNKRLNDNFERLNRFEDAVASEFSSMEHCPDSPCGRAQS